MTRMVVLVVFTLLCMNEIHGLKMFGKDPDYLSRLGRDQGYYAQDGGDSNRRESKNNDDKVIPISKENRCHNCYIVSRCFINLIPFCI